MEKEANLSRASDAKIGHQRNGHPEIGSDKTSSKIRGIGGMIVAWVMAVRNQ